MIINPDRTIRFGGIFLSAILMAFSVPLLAEDTGDESFELIIQDVTAATGGAALILGRVKTGTVAVGDTVCVPVYGKGTVATPVVALNHETIKVEKAEKGWRIELFVKGIEADLIGNNKKVTAGDC